MKDPRRRPAIQGSDPEALSRDEVRRLAKAERKLGSADRTQSAAGVREVQDIERRHGERIEAQSLAARLVETSSLALSRPRPSAMICPPPPQVPAGLMAPPATLKSLRPLVSSSATTARAVPTRPG